MDRPIRIQLSRRKGWRMPPDTVRVSRPGMWGNYAATASGLATGAAAVEAFRRWLEHEASEAWKTHAQMTLRGKNLACWCRLDQPCHADMLLELANRLVCEEVRP